MNSPLVYSPLGYSPNRGGPVYCAFGNVWPCRSFLVCVWWWRDLCGSTGPKQNLTLNASYFQIQTVSYLVIFAPESRSKWKIQYWGKDVFYAYYRWQNRWSRDSLNLSLSAPCFQRFLLHASVVYKDQLSTKALSARWLLSLLLRDSWSVVTEGSVEIASVLAESVDNLCDVK